MRPFCVAFTHTTPNAFILLYRVAIILLFPLESLRIALSIHGFCIRDILHSPCTSGWRGGQRTDCCRSCSNDEFDEHSTCFLPLFSSFQFSLQPPVSYSDAGFRVHLGVKWRDTMVEFCGTAVYGSWKPIVSSALSRARILGNTAACPCAARHSRRYGCNWKWLGS